MSVRFLIAGMLASGVCNTILNKLQDMQCVENCDDPDQSKHKFFEQPVWQTLNMFIGETMCFVAAYALLLRTLYRNAAPSDDISATAAANEVSTTDGLLNDSTEAVKVDDEHEETREQLSGWRVFLLWLPTMCDICGTTLMNVGLIYTSASVYQMLRGAVVLFTATFSVTFLRRRLLPYHWFSLFLVVLGVSVVGLSSVLFPPARPAEIDRVDGGLSDAALALVGVLFVLFAQVFTAAQFVIEECIMEKYCVAPLRTVGFEGVFGLITVCVGMVILNFTVGRAYPGGYFDVPVGWHQITGHPIVWQACIAICFSIAFFNFFGMSVTRVVSATARSTIDTCRIVFVWMVSLYFGWEVFAWLQVVGFIILILGTFMFNGVIDPPSCLGMHEAAPEERLPLVTPEDRESP